MSASGSKFFIIIDNAQPGCVRFKADLDYFLSRLILHQEIVKKEFKFLIINRELKSDGKDEF